MLKQVHARLRALLKRKVQHIVPRDLGCPSDDPAFRHQQRPRHVAGLPLHPVIVLIVGLVRIFAAARLRDRSLARILRT